MYHLIRLVFAFVLLLLAEAGARAEYPPSQDFYFLPTSVDLAPDMLSATAIDGDIIRKGLSKIPGKVTLFMDACNAGAGIQGGVSKVDMDGLVNNLSDGASIVMFASSTGREVSYEGPQWENGAFTEGAALDPVGSQCLWRRWQTVDLRNRRGADHPR
jgi:hypothetical protein